VNLRFSGLAARVETDLDVKIGQVLCYINFTQA